MEEQYRFIIEKKLTVNGVEPFTPNLNLLTFLKHYLDYSKRQIQDNAAAGPNTQKVLDLEMLGLLLWNYFFSRGIETNSKVISDLFERAKDPGQSVAQFAIQFNNDTDIAYKLMPWELLCWPKENDKPEDPCLLFRNEKIRLIRVGSLLPKQLDFQVKENKLKILFCVTGVPVNHKEAGDLEDRPENKPLRFDELESLKTRSRMIESELLVKLNGFPEQLLINGAYPEDKNKNNKKYFDQDHFDLGGLTKCIHEFQPHVVHIITHGRCDKDGNLQMVFNDGNAGLKLAWLNDDSEFVKIFKDDNYPEQKKPKLVFLQVCQSGQSSLPIALSSAGVVSVIAMFYDINQNIASKLASDFYDRLLGDKMEPVGEAFHKSRLQCWNELKKGNLGFGLPIIYYNLEKEDQPLISEDLKSKKEPTIPEQFAEELKDKYDKQKRSRSEGGALQNATNSESEFIKQMKGKVRGLFAEHEDEKNLIDNMQKAIAILFRDFLPGDEFKDLQDSLQGIVNEYKVAADKPKEPTQPNSPLLNQPSNSQSANPVN